jgi:hypothetical protein
MEEDHQHRQKQSIINSNNKRAMLVQNNNNNVNNLSGRRRRSINHGVASSSTADCSHDEKSKKVNDTISPTAMMKWRTTTSSARLHGVENHYEPTTTITGTGAVSARNNLSMMNIIKPVAMKVVRPIPKRASEQYYQQAYESGLALQDTNEAAMLAHDWHRKWTQQDERDHTTPDADFYKSTTTVVYYSNATTSSARGPVAAAAATAEHDLTFSMYGSSAGSTVSTTSSRKILLAHALELDRLRGAKNPSLGDSASTIDESPADDGEELQHGVVILDEDNDQYQDRFKRTRQLIHSANQFVAQQSPPSLAEPMMIYHQDVNEAPLLNPADRLSDSYSGSSSSSVGRPQAKRRFLGGQDESSPDGDDEYDDVGRPNGDRPQLAAPISDRPNLIRPTAVRFDRQDAAPRPAPDTRLIRPTPLVPPSRDGGGQTRTDMGVPKDITAYSGQQLSVSPISISSGTPSSSRSSGSLVPSFPPTTTVYDEQQRLQQLLHGGEPHVVHIIEDHEEEYDATPKLETTIVLDQDDDDMSCLSTSSLDDEVQQARDNALQALAVTGGDAESEYFKANVDPLEKYFTKQDLDTRLRVVSTTSIDGMWLTLSKPNFFGCLGNNENGDPMYTLGRMSFDMFSPTNLVCSLQGNFNPVEVVTEEERSAMLHLVPKSLREEVESGVTVLRTYHIVTAFTIEPNMAEFPNAPNKDVVRPIKGIMTTYGYSLPDPDTPNRHSIWITGGRIEPNDHPQDISAWKKLFNLHPPKHTFGQKAKLLAVKLLMGATVPEEVADDGSMEYTFTRPLGGHGIAYVDVIYLDESMRVVRGHRGTTFVFSRMPYQD